MIPRRNARSVEKAFPRRASDPHGTWDTGVSWEEATELARAPETVP